MTSPQQPSPVRPVQYKGEPLDAERGPGLGCFRFQLVILGVLIVLTPLSVAWAWPEAVSASLLIVTLVLLLFAGQTVIFLLRLVAADRREGRRRPLASATPTVGELEDRPPAGESAPAHAGEAAADGVSAGGAVAEGASPDGASAGGASAASTVAAADDADALTPDAGVRE